jgi:membrane associated rhomboid family serine protease
MTSVRHRLDRFPVLTLIVFVVTATTSVLQFWVPGMLAALQRSPQGLHGQWWRSGTSMFVQDGGVPGTVSNLLFLLLVGVLAEQVLTRPRWLVGYFGAGLVGEAAGYAWQPFGGGNSVAICGLVGVLLVASAFRPVAGDESGAWALRFAPIVVMYWCGALLGQVFWPALIVYVIGGIAAQVVAQRGRSVGRAVAVAGGIATVALVAETDIHGAALAAGIAIGTVFALLDRIRPDRIRSHTSEGAFP